MHTSTYIIIPLHSTSLGSGFHSPFPMHVDTLDPMIAFPGGQLRVILAPSAVEILFPLILTDVLTAVC